MGQSVASEDAMAVREARIRTNKNDNKNRSHSQQAYPEYTVENNSARA